MSHIVLLVDDEPSVLSALCRILRKEPYEIVTAGTAEEAARLLADREIDVVLSDEKMPGMSGTEFLARVARDYPDTVRIVLTGYPSLPGALRAINEGHVYQFLTKPHNDVDLAITIRRALEQKELLAKSRRLLKVTSRPSSLIDQAQLLRRLRDVAPTDQAPAAPPGEQPLDHPEPLEQIDQEVCSSRELPTDVGEGQGH